MSVRRPVTVLRAQIGSSFAAIRFRAYVLLTGIGVSFGHGGALTPFLAGFAPVLLGGIVSLYLGLRLLGPR
jgi:lipopolysaccharide export LptBFGC system permease protein LptF